MHLGRYLQLIFPLQNYLLLSFHQTFMYCSPFRNWLSDLPSTSFQNAYQLLYVYISLPVNRCPAFAVISHASLDTVNATEGVTNSMTCLPGYQYNSGADSINSTCTSGLAWTPEVITAVCNREYFVIVNKSAHRA